MTWRCQVLFEEAFGEVGADEKELAELPAKAKTLGVAGNPAG
jgi:hypothetical protein